MYKFFAKKKASSDEAIQALEQKYLSFILSIDTEKYLDEPIQKPYTNSFLKNT